MTCNNPVSAVSCDGDVAVAALTCCTDPVDPPPDEDPVVEVTHRISTEAAYRALTPSISQSPSYNPSRPGGPLQVPSSLTPTDIDPPPPSNGGSHGHHWYVEVSQ